MTMASALIAASTLAQTAGPIRIITGEPEPPPFDWVPVAAVVGSTVLLIALCAIVARIARRRYRQRPPEDVAFQTLARRMKLARVDRTAIQELALKAGIQSPVAVLVSRGAFDQLMLTALGRGAPAESIRRVRRLGQRLRWLTEAEAEAVVEAKPKPDAAPARRAAAAKTRTSPAASAAAAPAAVLTPNALAPMAARKAAPAPSVPGRNGRGPSQR